MRRQIRAVVAFTLLDALLVVVFGLFAGERRAESSAVTGAGLGAYLSSSSNPEVGQALILFTGQSTSVGGLSFDAGSPFACPNTWDDAFQLGDTTGLYNDAASTTYYRAPLCYFMRPYVDAAPNIAAGYNVPPNNIIGETPAESATKKAKIGFAAAHLANYQWGAESVGVGGQSINCIEQDSSAVTSPAGVPCNSFDFAMASVKAFTTNPRLDSGFPFRVYAGANFHGEADCPGGALGFGQLTRTMYQAYQTRIQAVTGQTQPIPWITRIQTSRCAGLPYIDNFSTIGQISIVYESYSCPAAAGNPLCVQGLSIPWADTVEHTHFSNLGEQQAGGAIAKGLTKLETWFNGGPWWNPLMATSVSYNAGTFTWTVTFNVPGGVLAFDTSNGEPHQSGALSLWSACHGFEPWSGNPLDGQVGNPGWPNDGGAANPNPVGCASATIVGGNTVVVVGTAASDHLALGMTPDDFNSLPGGATGTAQATWGRVHSLRDTDTSFNDPQFGTPVYDWAVPIPYYPTTWGGVGNWDGGP